VYGGSEQAAFYALSVREVGSRLIAAGLLAPDDAEQIDAFTQDPACRWLSLGMVTSWGKALLNRPTWTASSAPGRRLADRGVARRPARPHRTGAAFRQSQYPTSPLDITRLVREQVPAGAVLDGELVIYQPDRERTSFAALQRRIAAGASALRMAREHPASYVIFDVLADPDGPLLNLPQKVLGLLSTVPACGRPHTASRSLSADMCTTRSRCWRAWRTRLATTRAGSVSGTSMPSRLRSQGATSLHR
jgi:hypothetical protein